jgi:hypothetical protein
MMIKSLMNIGPPYFTSPLESLTIKAPATKNYTLPIVEDPDNDSFKVQVQFSTFIKFLPASNTLIFSPTQKDVSIEPYSIKIVLLDQNKYTPKKSSYTLSVMVISDSQSGQEDNNKYSTADQVNQQSFNSTIKSTKVKN